MIVSKKIHSKVELIQFWMRKDYRHHWIICRNFGCCPTRQKSLNLRASPNLCFLSFGSSTIRANQVSYPVLRPHLTTTRSYLPYRAPHSLPTYWSSGAQFLDGLKLAEDHLYQIETSRELPSLIDNYGA